MAVSRKKQPGTPVRRPRPLGEKQIVAFLFGIGLVLTTFLGTLLFGLEQLKIPDIRSVSHYRPLQSTVIYDRHGKVVDRLFRENREVVGLDRMHPLLPKAFVAAEDSRFFEHPGLDTISLFRALLNNLRQGRKSQGGSTITQQVAKGLLLTPEKTYLRKFKEAILARRIDSLLSKDEILYIYLNQIYLGEGAYGVEAAAQTYFGRTAAELNLGQIAILAGLPQAPSRYSPLSHWERARARQRYVLNRMAADGYISREEARKAYLAEPGLFSRKSRLAGDNGYYLQEVKQRAEQMLGVDLGGAGVRIYTNLDQSLQRQAAGAVRSGVAAVVARQGGDGTRPEGALVCLETCSGKVLALTGGTDFAATPFNRATQARRPAGSVFKPLVYAEAFERGWSPASTVIDEPLSIPGRDGTVWRPKNFSGRHYGPVSLATALIHSYNIPAIKLLRSIGIQPVVRLAKASGISSPVPEDLSLALGSVDVSLLEMSGAYLPFVCRGRYRQPTLIDRITTLDGTELYAAGINPAQVLSEESAGRLYGLLAEVVRNGSGRKARGLPGKSGGKTGTSDENRDAWFIGYHNRLLGGVWIGHDRNQTLGQSENGGSTAAPVWHAFMSSIETR